MGRAISSTRTYVQISAHIFPFADRRVLLAELEHHPAFLDAQEGRQESADGLLSGLYKRVFRSRNVTGFKCRRLGWHRDVHDSGDCDPVLVKRAKEDRHGHWQSSRCPCDGCVVRVDLSYA